MKTQWILFPSPDLAKYIFEKLKIRTSHIWTLALHTFSASAPTFSYLAKFWQISALAWGVKWIKMGRELRVGAALKWAMVKLTSTARFNPHNSPSPGFFSKTFIMYLYNTCPIYVSNAEKGSVRWEVDCATNHHNHHNFQIIIQIIFILNEQLFAEMCS